MNNRNFDIGRSNDRNNSADNGGRERRIISEDDINYPEFDPSEFAPAPSAENSVTSSEGGDKRSAMIFAIICAIFALIIAAVGALCNIKGGDVTDRRREALVMSGVPNSSGAEFYKSIDGCDVYAALFNDKLAGYGVFKTVNGWGGSIEVLVCFDSDDTVIDVIIVSENESDSLGDKIRQKSFLSGFIGMNANKSNNETDEKSAAPDLISGATVSSSAVIDAVDGVLEMGLFAHTIASDMRIKTISSQEIQEEIGKDTQSSEDSTDNGPSSTDDEHGYKNDETKLDGATGGSNINNGSGDVGADVSDVTTVYDTETDKDKGTTAEETTVAEIESDSTPEETTKKDPVVTTEPEPDTDESSDSEEPSDSDSEPENTDPVDTDENENTDDREPVDNSQSSIFE